MACPISPDEIGKLKLFIGVCSQNPTILNIPQLGFFKTFIEQLGGKVPAGDASCPPPPECKKESSGPTKPTPQKNATAPEADTTKMENSDSEIESDVEIDMTGCIEVPDDDPVELQQMGDPDKEVSEDEIDKASELRSKAAGAYSDEKYDESLALYTEAIIMNPKNALFFAKRGQTYLKMNKPNACVRDCNRALELNCDSAAAHKFRGRAFRLLGKWQNAAADLQQACKLDYDEECDEWLREVKPMAKKLNEHQLKVERRATERELRKRKERAAKGGVFTGASGGGDKKPAADGGDDAGSMEDVFAALGDPEISAAIQDILTNPMNINKYRDNPKLMKIASKLVDVNRGFGGGFPDMFKMGAQGAQDPAAATTGDVPPKKPPPPTDFQDDGLD